MTLGSLSGGANREKEEWKEAKRFQRSIEEITEEAAG